MPITRPATLAATLAAWLAPALLALPLVAAAAMAPADQWDPSVPGTPACLEAAASGDVDAAVRSCGGRDAASNPLDAFNLALVLHPQRPELAVALLRSAGDAGLAEADQVLGNLLLDAGDTDAGMNRLERAARAGLALAQYDYATALLEGDAGADETRAAEAAPWYGWAAAGGDNAARYNLGVLLLGDHLGRSRPLWAWAWFSSLTTMEGHEEVRRLATELASQMNNAERERAHDHLAQIQRDPAAAAAAAVTRSGPGSDIGSDMGSDMGPDIRSETDSVDAARGGS